MFFDELHARRNRVLDPQPDTDLWIWTHGTYLKWLKKSSGALWIQGKPGSGKSTLAKAIQQSILKQSKAQTQNSHGEVRESIAAGYFYSRRGGSSETKHLFMLRSLLYQILDQKPSLYDMFKKPFRHLLYHSTGQVQWTYHAMVALLLSLVQDGTEKNADHCGVDIYVLLDAMDESEDEDIVGCRRKDILTLMSTLSSKRSKRAFKIIILSRPTIPAQLELRNFYNIRMDQENRQDIGRIADAGLRLMWNFIVEQDEEQASDTGSEDRDNSPEMLPSDRWDTERSSILGMRYIHEKDSSYTNQLAFVKDYLTQEASGVILWVVLILGELIRHVEGGSYTNKEIDEKLRSLPKDLEMTYEEIIHRLLRTNNAQEVAQAEVMLVWATFADRPLSVREFRDATAMLPSDWDNQHSLHDRRIHVSSTNWAPVKRRIFKICGGLLETIESEHKSQKNLLRTIWHVNPGDTVQLLHQTAKDFLLFNQNPHKFQLKPSEGQYIITMTAIRYLRAFLLSDRSRIKPFFIIPLKKDCLEYVERILDFPLLGYVLSFLPQRVCTSTSHDVVSEFSIILLENLNHLHYRSLGGWIQRFLQQIRKEHVGSSPLIASQLNAIEQQMLSLSGYQ